MQKRVIDITPEAKLITDKKRVAAYARVSCGKDTMLHSLAAQIDFYRNYIIHNPGWEFAGVYADEAKTGTKDSREQFQKLLADCRSGYIDMVVTKSISRFARNTVTLLKTVRELKELGINVFFEDQNMDTISEEGELMLTLMASVAQEESLSCSDNCKWRIRKGFEQGQPNTCTMLGYRLVDGEITVVPEEAKIVKEIYDCYLSGNGVQAIANTLNERGIKTEKIPYWHPDTIRGILRNEKYKGDLLLQKTLNLDHLSKRQMPNTGELPQYHIEGDHEPIVSKEVFTEVQEEVKRRQKRHPSRKGENTAFTGKIRCSICGKNYRRKTTQYNIVWCCSTFNSKGKKYCESKSIPEETLKQAVSDVLGIDCFDEGEFLQRVDHIEAYPDNLLSFVFKGGRTADCYWKDRSRSESWTPQMKEKARQNALRRHAK